MNNASSYLFEILSYCESEPQSSKDILTAYILESGLFSILFQTLSLSGTEFACIVHLRVKFYYFPITIHGLSTS
jgi:hypothetical protein